MQVQYLQHNNDPPILCSTRILCSAFLTIQNFVLHLLSLLDPDDSSPAVYNLMLRASQGFNK